MLSHLRLRYCYLTGVRWLLLGQGRGNTYLHVQWLQCCCGWRGGVRVSVRVSASVRGRIRVSVKVRVSDIRAQRVGLGLKRLGIRVSAKRV